MHEIKLTAQEKEELDRRHKKTRCGKERDRIKAVLLRAEGWGTSQIAQALRVSDSTVTDYLSDYINKKKLTSNSGGSESFLNKKQTEELINHLTERTYSYQYEIVAYIKERYEVVLSVSGLNKWLKRNGFVYKKPKGVPHKFDAEKQLEFEAYYDELKSSLGKEETLLFMDAVHPTQTTKVSSGWFRSGHEKTIETTGSKTRVNLIGAIELTNLPEAVVRSYQTVNRESILHFLEEIKKHRPQSKRIHLVLDRAPYHRSEEVKEKARELGIILHYLPPYSPNLNPIERLWKVMNKHIRNNRYFATAKEFRKSIEQYFSKTWPDIGDDYEDTINDDFERLKPAF